MKNSYMDIQNLGLARTVARLAAAYALAEPAEALPIVRHGNQVGWTLPSGASITETIRKDAEALAAADMIETPDPRDPLERMVLTFTASDARVVLRRLVASPTDGLDRFGRLIGLDEDRTVNPGGNPLHRAMCELHQTHGRGQILAINARNKTVAYRIDGAGVRRRPFRIEGRHLHVGRFCAEIRETISA